MSIGALWLIYFIVLIVFFLLCYIYVQQRVGGYWGLAGYSVIGLWGPLLSASFLALIVLLVATCFSDYQNMTSDQKTQLALLIFIAFLVPLVCFFYICFESRRHYRLYGRVK